MIKLNKVSGVNCEDLTSKITSKFKCSMRFFIISSLWLKFKIILFSKFLDTIVHNNGFDLLFIRKK